MTGWSGAALQSMQRTVGRVSRAGLSSKRVVASHQKRGHDVASFPTCAASTWSGSTPSVDGERAGITRPPQHSQERVQDL